MKLVVIDYGIGNIRSISNALKKLGVTTTLSRDRDEILNADGLILPGVGAFAQGMKNLNKYSLVDVLREYSKLNRPLLGICLGMQLLFDESEEFTTTKGLGLIAGKVIKLPTHNVKRAKLPHISWNEIGIASLNQKILKDIETDSDMYFVHSYVVKPQDERHILSTTAYLDYNFCSMVKKNNIYGCQFHPEKSAKDGLKLLENFIKIIKETQDV